MEAAYIRGMASEVEFQVLKQLSPSVCWVSWPLD